MKGAYTVKRTHSHTQRLTAEKLSGSWWGEAFVTVNVAARVCISLRMRDYCREWWSWGQGAELDASGQICVRFCIRMWMQWDLFWCFYTHFSQDGIISIKYRAMCVCGCVTTVWWCGPWSFPRGQVHHPYVFSPLTEHLCSPLFHPLPRYTTANASASTHTHTHIHLPCL